LGIDALAGGLHKDKTFSQGPYNDKKVHNPIFYFMISTTIMYQLLIQNSILINHKIEMPLESKRINRNILWEKK